MPGIQDLQMQFFLSGLAHVYYGLLAGIFAAVAVLAGASPLWLVIVLVTSGAVFADVWTNGYMH